MHCIGKKYRKFNVKLSGVLLQSEAKKAKKSLFGIKTPRRFLLKTEKSGCGIINVPLFRFVRWTDLEKSLLKESEKGAF